MPEARNGKRFPLQLPVRVAGKNGVTKNVSGAGLYLDADQDLAVGSSIELELILPADTVNGSADVHVRCTGHVVRVDPPGNRPDNSGGLACVIDYYKMTRAEEKEC
ncbi:MAG: PilZ domain-containing protein [Acidobacteriales bacterium]|nr:PilZ domain-containing protein [Terriglobales bacterium]